MLRKKGITNWIVLVLSLGVLTVFLLGIDPQDKSLAIVFIPIVFVWLALFSLTQAGLRLVTKRYSRMNTIIAFMSVSFVVLLLMLTGVGQLTLRDVLITMALIAVSSFYFYRSWG